MSTDSTTTATTTPSTVTTTLKTDYEHLGEQCWSQCGEKTGYCPQFCGSGLCCRQGFTGNGCNGYMGDYEHHVCVKDPDDDGHLGEQCWSQCGEQTGYCPQFCGSGLCCRQGFIGNGCNGNMGDQEHHVCVEDQDDITFEDSKYIFMADRRTVDEAEAYCNDLNFDLVSIESESENQFLASQIVKLVPGERITWWTAGKRVDNDTWAWGLSGDPWATEGDDGRWRNWGLAPPDFGGKEPNNWGGNENCIDIFTGYEAEKKDGTWNDKDCDNDSRFICEQQLTKGT